MTLSRALRLFLASTLLAFCTAPLHAQPNRVRLTEGRGHGFVVIRDQSGARIGVGELIQFAHGNRVTSRINFHFRDGSLDEETTVFTQAGTFKIVSDHHIQRGPFFSKNVDFSFSADGNATSRTTSHDGKEKVETSHFDLPPDLANGLIGILLANVAPDGPPFSLTELAPTAKGRLVKLEVSPAGQGTFTLDGLHRTASIFRIHTALGGVAGVVAPIIGKQPEDIFVWVLEGEAPALVRGIGQLSEGGPIVDIQLAGSTFPRADKH